MYVSFFQRRVGMRYIINNNIIYHEDSFEIGSVHDDVAPLPLTSTQNRLLLLLIRNHDIMLSREMLLEQVWQTHGQVASGSNLNNGISTLRKMFSALEAEDVIVTLPRQGFKFVASELIIGGSEPPADEPVPLPFAPLWKKRFLSPGLRV